MNIGQAKAAASCGRHQWVVKALERKEQVSRVRYLLVNPRGFANEFGVYRVEPSDRPQAEQLIASYEGDPHGFAHWITLRQALRITARERRMARDLRRAGINLTTNPVGACYIDRFDECFPS